MMLRSKQLYSSSGPTLWTWNSKQPVLNGCLVKQPSPKSQVQVWKHPIETTITRSKSPFYPIFGGHDSPLKGSRFEPIYETTIKKQILWGLQEWHAVHRIGWKSSNLPLERMGKEHAKTSASHSPLPPYQGKEWLRGAGVLYKMGPKTSHKCSTYRDKTTLVAHSEGHWRPLFTPFTTPSCS